MIEGPQPADYANFCKKDTIERNNHADEDMSYKVSPFKNRIAISDQYRSSLGYKTLN